MGGKRPRPQPGGQTLFDQSEADVCLFGSGVGVGKSYALLLTGGKWTQVRGVRAYRGIFFRRTKTALKGGNGLWDKSQPIYRAWGGRGRTSPDLDWVFEASSGRIEDRHRIEFRHLQREADVFEHAGRDYDFVGFDELQTFTRAQFWFMFSRLRSVSGVRPHLRATCNPDPDVWFLKELLEWWIGPDGYAIPERRGVIRWFVRDAQTDLLTWFDDEASARNFARELDPVNDPEGLGAVSFTFIYGTLEENVELLRADPRYRSRLSALLRVDRKRLVGERNAEGRERGGNWHVRESAGTYFARNNFVIASEPPSRIVRTLRGWDVAASPPTPKHPNPDWTRGARVCLCEKGELWIDDMVSAQAGPVEVLELQLETARRDGRATTVALWQDTGGAGKTAAETTADALTGHIVALVDSFGAGEDLAIRPKGGSSRAKRAFARAWAPLVEKRRVYVRRAEWTDEFLAECDGFPEARFDDQVDAVSCAVQVLVGQGLGFWGSLKEAAAKMEGTSR